MVTIYHNPRCSKSREGLAYLEEHNIPVHIVKYLDEPLSKETLTHLLELLKIPALQLVRTKEAEWIATYKGKDLSEEEVIEALHLHPKLIERPIVVNGNQAIIARPFTEIEKIL